MFFSSKLDFESSLGCWKSSPRVEQGKVQFSTSFFLSQESIEWTFDLNTFLTCDQKIAQGFWWPKTLGVLQMTISMTTIMCKIIFCVNRGFSAHLNASNSLVWSSLESDYSLNRQEWVSCPRKKIIQDKSEKLKVKLYFINRKIPHCISQNLRKRDTIFLQLIHERLKQNKNTGWKR